MKKITIILCVLQITLFAQNALTQKEIKQGWKLLFDGKTTNGWRNFKSKTINSQWKVEDGCLVLSDKNGGDIVSENQYESFELNLEWKISDCGNSGIFYHVAEDTTFGAVYSTGPEMQILDDTCHPDNKWKNHRAGSLYDMIAPSKVTVKKAGEWNKVKLIVKGNQVKHFLNDVMIVQYTLFDKKWDEMIANSKFKDWKGFGKYKKGYIALQDHGDKVYFKNIKIRVL